MADNEEKKNFSSVGVLKKTEKSANEIDDQIGVEADIPMEDEIVADSLDITSNLKPNISRESAKGEGADESLSHVEPKERKVQVFNISAGKVIEKDLLNKDKKSEQGLSDKEIEGEIHSSHLRQSSKTTSTAKTEELEGVNKLYFIVVGLLILLVLFYLLFGSKCGENKKEEIPPPAINLSK